MPRLLCFVGKLNLCAYFHVIVRTVLQLYIRELYLNCWLS